jgi:hypothetical protein
MNGGAGPCVAFCALNHSGTNWIELDVTNSRPKVLLIKCGRIRPRLPQVTCQLVLQIEQSGIHAMTPMKGLTDRVLPFRNCNDMDMVGHQAVRADSKTRSLATSFQKTDVELAVRLIAKHVESTDSSLGNVERNSR